MTEKEALFTYRLKQAEETLSDVEKMSQENLSPRYHIQVEIRPF